MRAAGVITGLLILGTSVIPGSYMENPGDRSKLREPGASSRVPAAELDPGSAILSGRVFDEGGRPVPGASVSLAGSGFWPPRVVETGFDGRFHWPSIPAGVYELRISNGAFSAPPIDGLILDPGAHRAFAVRLARGWLIEGKVVDAATGAGIEGAEVTLATGALGLHTQKTKTDVGGRFEVDGVTGDDQTLYVDAEGYVPTGPLVQPAQAPPLAIRLQPAGHVEGRVVDTRGRAVANAWIRAFDEERSAPLETARSLGVTSGPVPPISAAGVVEGVFVGQATSGTDGRFTLAKLRPGTYTVIAAHDDFAPRRTRQVFVRRGGIGSPLVIELERGAELLGRVVDDRGSELEGIPVELRTPGDPLPRMTITAEDGSFSFRGVRGDVRVAAVPHDMPHVRETIAIGSDALVSVELTLPTTLFTLRGRVVDERGFGVSSALLTVTSKDRTGKLERSAKSDADGTFSVPALPAPPYSLRVEHPGFSPTRMAEVDPHESILVVMAAGVTFLGRVLDDWASEPLSGATVRVQGPVEANARTRRDGTFVFRQLPTGTYDVSLSHDDFEPQQRRVAIEPPRYVDRPQDLGTIRLTPGGFVEGEVVDVDGVPVADAEVTWGEPPRWNRAVRTDARGAFRLRGVPAGSEWITARHERAGESWTQNPVAVRPLETSPGALIRLPKDIRE